MSKSEKPEPSKGISPWFWVPSLYYAEGIPYVVVMIISVIMYKRLGISNTEIALYTSWLYLPWVIKPLWSPLVDLFRTKRFWIVFTQMLVGAGLACIALTIPTTNFFKFTLAFFWLLAFSSATHDIAADGFYMLGLTQHQQAWFVGVRSTFYRFAMLTGQGLLVILAGYIESNSGLDTVNIHVNAVTEQREIVEYDLPDSLNIQALDGELRIVTTSDSLNIVTMTREPQEIDTLLKHVQAWNSANGHLTDEQKEKKGESSSPPSWWQRNIVKGIEHLFLSVFGSLEEKETSQKLAGNIGIMQMHLSKPPEPGNKVIINLSRDSGDKSIELIEGNHAIFTENNWNKPIISVIQIDPKLKQVSSAQFSARAGNIPLSWILTFLFMTVLFAIFAIYHYFVLPHPVEDVPRKSESFQSFLKEFGNTFLLFFKKKGIGVMIAFLLLYRLGESQLVKIASPFLLDPVENGGLGLTTGQLGFVYGTVGMLLLTAGGLLGGFVAAKHGLKKWIWWMAIAINVPDAVYIYLANTQPDSFTIINICVGIEQFGYGFGFTAYMLFMIYISQGKYKAAHFAITTAFMALGMMLPGMVSGWIQELIGYPDFFVWVLITTIPGIILIKFLPLDPEFGKKSTSE